MNNTFKAMRPLSEEEVRRAKIMRMLRLRLPLTLIVFVVLAVPGTLAVWKLVPQEYKASADVRFLASTPRVMGHSTGEAAVPYDKFLNTQVSLITGNAVLSHVLEDPSVGSLPGIAKSKAPLELLKRLIKAEMQPNSELVTISCTLPDRDAAILLVDKTLTAYMHYALAEEADTGGERLRVLTKERDSRQAELDAQLKQVSELQQKIEMPIATAASLGPDNAKAYQETHARAEEDVSRMGSKAKLLDDQVAQIDELEKQYRAAPGKPLFGMGVEDKVAVDPRVVAMRTEFIKADAEFAGVAERYGNKSPQYEVEHDKNNALRGRLTQTEQTVRGETIASMRALLQKDLGATRSEAEDAQARKTGFEALIGEERARSMEASKTLAAMDEAKLRAEETRTLLRAVRDEITSITVESNAPARVKIAAPPSVPAVPGIGRRLQLMILVLLGAGTAGMSLAFLRELTDQQIRSAEDITSVTDCPVLALIPHAGAEVPALPESPAFAGDGRALILHPNRNSLGWTRKATAVAERPDTAVGNEIRKVLSTITSECAEMDAGEAVGACMVTSAVPGDGKTLVACNLAIALTQANRRVLLMEVSPKGDLEEALGMEPDCGLTEVLLRGMPLLAAVHTTPFPGLYVLGAGFEPEKLTMKMASREMAGIINQAKQDFDHVVIDAPPILAMADASLLASIVDGVVLVAGAGVSKLEMVRQASMELRRTRARILGVVLNCTKASCAPPMPGVARYEDYLSKKRPRPSESNARTVQDAEPDSVEPSPLGGDSVEPGAQRGADTPRLMEAQ